MFLWPVSTTISIPVCVRTGTFVCFVCVIDAPISTATITSTAFVCCLNEPFCLRPKRRTRTSCVSKTVTIKAYNHTISTTTYTSRCNRLIYSEIWVVNLLINKSVSTTVVASKPTITIARNTSCLWIHSCRTNQNSNNKHDSLHSSVP